jgi:fluoride exporter
MLWLWIGAVGIFATLLRFIISLKTNLRVGVYFPYGTLFVNLFGCFFAGICLNLSSLSTEMRFILSSGFFSTFTTFSTVIIETENFLLRKKSPVLGVFNLFLQTGGGIFAYFWGKQMTQLFGF